MVTDYSAGTICTYKILENQLVLSSRKLNKVEVFGTNNSTGIKVFKEAEFHAANLQDQIKQEKEFGDQIALFAGDAGVPVTEELRKKYREAAFARVCAFLEEVGKSSYEQVFCKAMAMPLVSEDELLAFLTSHPRIILRLSGKRRKKPNISNSEDLIEWSKN